MSEIHPRGIIEASRVPELYALPESPMSEEASLLAVIAKAARDPAVDVDKLERLMAMHERAQSVRAKAAYADALAELQAKIPVIKERGRIQIGTDAAKAQKYALWEDVNEAIRPLLHAHGFSLSFRTGDGDGKLTVTAILLHRDGHQEETTKTFPLDTSGSKNSIQSVGSSISYGKRYTASALLNLTSGETDDDGRAAGGKSRETITEDQIGELQAMIDSAGADKAAFLRFIKVESLADIFADKYAAAVDLLKQKAARK